MAKYEKLAKFRSYNSRSGQIRFHKRAGRLVGLNLLGGVCVLALFAGQAIAQDAGQGSEQKPQTGSKIESVTVTAERRAENLQDVPEAVTAYTGADLKDRGISSARDLVLFTPNATFSSNVGNLQISMRGVGETWSLDPVADSAVAVYIDGIYQARPAVGNLESIFANLDRVEVLRGPQGTLYGRNSTGGVINFITKDPTDTLSLYGTASIESYTTADVLVGISGPIGDKISASIDGAYKYQNDGYGKNLFLGNPLDRSQSGRVSGKVKFDILPTLTWKVGVDYNTMHEDGPGDQHLTIVPPLALFLGGFTLAANPRDTYSDRRRLTNVESSGVTSDLAWDAGSFSIKSLTGFRHTRNNTSGLDFDGTQLNLFNTNPQERGTQISQEFIASSNTSASDRFQWIAGVFYLQENFLAYLPTQLGAPVLGFPAQSIISVKGTTVSLGVYVDGTYRITDSLSATLGLRYNDERKTGTLTQCFFATSVPTPCNASNALFVLPEKVASQAPTGRFVLTYKPQDSFLLYTSVSRGYRSGGFNNAGPGTFKPEYLWAYEIGAKTNPTDNLQLNLTAFYYNDQDVQVQQVLLNGSNTSNASSATIKGVELEAIFAPTDTLTFDSQISWLHARYNQFFTFSNFFSPPLGVIQDPTLLNATPVIATPGLYNLAGSHLPRSPEFKAHLGAQYEQEVASLGGELKFRYDISWSDSYFLEYYNRAATEQRSYFMHDIRLSYLPDGGNWEFAVYGRNLGNANVIVKGTTVGGGVNDALVGYGPPQIFGGEISYRLNR